MMSTRTLAADQTDRPAVGCRRDGAAMRDRASLIEAHIPPLRCFACTLRRGDRQAADDLVHDCLERAVSRWHLRRAEGDVRGWLYTILYNRFLTDKHRQPRRGMRYCKSPRLVDGGQDWAPAHRDLLRAFAAFPRSNGRWCF
jgi:RNA polymerase sigma-70 factor (ECF subfamily)